MLEEGSHRDFSLTNPDGNNCNHIASQWAQLRSTLTCPPPPKWVWKRRFISGFQREMCSCWEMSVFQLLVISKFNLTQAASGNTSPRCCYSCMMKCTSCPSGISGSDLDCEDWGGHRGHPWTQQWEQQVIISTQLAMHCQLFVHYK